MHGEPDPLSSQSEQSFDSSIRFRLSSKIILLLGGLVTLIVLSVGGWLYQKDKQRVLENLQNQLQLAANTISLSIDGDMYKKLRGKESVNSKEYAQVISVLERFMVNRYLGFERNNIYTFRVINDSTLQFTAMLDQQYVGNTYAIRDEMRPTLENGQPSYTDIYMDENGTWVSAYAPILDSTGDVVGLVEADFQNNVFLLSLQQEQREILVFMVIALLISLILSLLFARYLSRPITEVSKAAMEISTGNFEIEIPVRTSDEIGRLTRAFNFMVQEIQEKEYIRSKNKEISEANRKLDELNQSLREANRLKSEFLAIAAHDLKNPLQVIQGYLEIIGDNTRPGEKTREYCESISAAIQRMLKLIRQLLDTTAIESGKLKLRKERIDLTGLLNDIVQDQQKIAGRKQQTIYFSSDQTVMVDADPSRIYEVFENLLSNAIKFSPFEKDIFVSLNSSEKQGSTVQVAIRDEGPGLTAEDKQKLFGRFMRLSALPTGGEVSTGLGLSVVRQLTELHGGRVWAASEGRDKGATFFVELNQAVN